MSKDAGAPPAARDTGAPAVGPRGGPVRAPSLPGPGPSAAVAPGKGGGDPGDARCAASGASASAAGVGLGSLEGSWGDSKRGTASRPGRRSLRGRVAATAGVWGIWGVSARVRTVPPWGPRAQGRTGAGRRAGRNRGLRIGKAILSATIDNRGQWSLIRRQEIPLSDENVTSPVDPQATGHSSILEPWPNDWLPAPPRCRLPGAPGAMGPPSGPGGRAGGSWAGLARSGRVSEPRWKKSRDDRTLVARTLGSPQSWKRPRPSVTWTIPLAPPVSGNPAWGAPAAPQPAGVSWQLGRKRSKSGHQVARASKGGQGRPAESRPPGAHLPPGSGQPPPSAPRERRHPGVRRWTQRSPGDAARTSRSCRSGPRLQDCCSRQPPKTHGPPEISEL